MKKDIDLPAIPPSQDREATAIGNDQLTRKKLQGLLHLITAELKARGTKTPHVFLPYRSRVDDGKLEVFLKRVFPGGIMIDVSRDTETRALLAEFDEFTLTCGLKFLWCRLPNNEIIGWDTYLEFKRKEAEAGYPKDAFLAIMPKCLSSAAHASIVYDFLDLLISLSANSQYNHLNGQKIAKMASIWAFSCAPKSSSAFYDATMVREVSFLEGLEAWKKLSNGLFHLLLSFLRAMLPDTEAETLNLPKTLQSLLIANTYPPPEDINPVKSVITIPCVHVRSTRKSADPYELISKIRHTLRFDKKDAFLSIENYTILKNIFQKESTAEIVSTLTEESRRCLARLTTKSESSKYNIYPGWARLSNGVNPNIPLFSEISISSVTLQDYYIWTWLSSLASDQSASMKSLFGRSIVVEAGLRGFQKWMIITETTILSDEYTAMFKSTGPAKKDLPLPPANKVMPKDEAPLPRKTTDDAPPPPVEKDSLFNEIASAIDNIGLDNKEPISDYQVYYNSLAQAENREDSPVKSLSPPASKNMRDRPRPPPLELQASTVTPRVRPPSPKKEPTYPEPVDSWNANNVPEFQGYKVYAKELSLLPDRSVLEPINDHQRSSENIPAKANKPPTVLEVPQRSERRVSPEAIQAPIEYPEASKRQPSSQQIRSMVNIPGHFPQDPAEKHAQPINNFAKEGRNDPYPKSHLDLVADTGLKPVKQHAHSPPKPPVVEPQTYRDPVEPQSYKKSLEPEKYREDVDYGTLQAPAQPDSVKNPPLQPERKDNYEDLNIIPNSHTHNNISHNSRDARFDEPLHSRQEIPYDRYNELEQASPQDQTFLPSPEKKKKKKKRKPKMDGEFSMPNHLPDGPPPEFPPMGDFPEEFLQHAKQTGLELPQNEMEYQPKKEKKPHKSKKKRSPDQQPPAGEYFPQPTDSGHQYYNQGQQNDYYDQNNHYDTRNNSSFDGSNNVPARSQDRGYSEPIVGNNSFQRSEPGYQESPMGYHPPDDQQPHGEGYPLQHGGRPQQHQQQYQPQVPPQQLQQRHQMPPQASHQIPPQQFQNPSAQFQQPPQQFQQFQQPLQYSAPMHQNYAPNMQWQQPQGYAPQPQAYAPAPQGFTPPPQGYGAPMQPMYHPQQGYFPPQQQYGKPRPKPTTSELTMMNMPMAVGIKKKPNKAGMRAALNQGFGI